MEGVRTPSKGVRAPFQGAVRAPLTGFEGML